MNKKSLQERLSELPEEERNKRIEDLIDSILSVVDWENTEESFAWVRITREVVFKKYGADALSYMDKQIGILGSASKGMWGGKNDMPQPAYDKPDADCPVCDGKGWYFVNEWIGSLQGRKDCKCKNAEKDI